MNNMIKMLRTALVLLVFMTATGTLSAQEKRVTLSRKNMTRQQVIQNIEQQTGYSVVYTRDVFNDAVSLNIRAAEYPLPELMEKLVESTGHAYRIDSNHILIYNSKQPRKGETIVAVQGLQLAETDKPEKTATATQTTAYFVPRAEHSIRAFSDEPKTDYSFVPSAQMQRTYLPKAAVKVNLLYLATTTPNLAIEFGLGKKWTLDITGGLNVWDLNGNDGGIRHWLVQPEVRYWFCQRFEKHYIGLHGIGGQYQIEDINLSPFGNDLRNKRYDGYGIGGGVSYGYHLPMGKRWGWEFTAGIGYIYLSYDKYNCGECDKKVGDRSKHYFGPTKVGVSLVFMLK